jgi:two-component system OmpR family response regulator/two-component system response regulator QseB
MGATCMRSWPHEKVDLLIIDLGLPYIDGLALIEQLRAKGDETPILAITAHDPALHARHGARTGANDLIQKPFDQEDLLQR